MIHFINFLVLFFRETIILDPVIDKGRFKLFQLYYKEAEESVMRIGPVSEHRIFVVMAALFRFFDPLHGKMTTHQKRLYLWKLSLHSPLVRAAMSRTMMLSQESILHDIRFDMKMAYHDYKRDGYMESFEKGGDTNGT